MPTSQLRLQRQRYGAPARFTALGSDTIVESRAVSEQPLASGRQDNACAYPGAIVSLYEGP
ncbi:hypothetical protein WS72_19700 [Burkholderia savannae]|uniref:Uncharacterized protein n=1 Tax=Burkholderia savannae TaxID=1637837 RepID=A0ABR5T1Y1_9BURK|nr:hypothetical protein WS72_19700 [Burkholderia savannae]